VDFRSRLVRAEGRTATFSDGTSVEVSAVVWATGFRPDFTWIDATATTADGHLRHREGRTVGHDAEHIAAQVAAQADRLAAARGRDW
jgi:NAD(P)H-nitrite reductase large subunit